MAFYAAFYKGTRPGLGGLYNRIVRWWDKGKYSHCELVFSDGVSASASFLDGGVRFKHIEFSEARWDAVALDGRMEEAAREWFEEHAGAKYDLLGNLRFFFGFLPDNKNRWFCSEAIAAALGKSEPWRYGPNGLIASLRDMLKMEV